MEQDKIIEEKLKIEGETASLKRELKLIFGQLDSKKQEYHSTSALVEKNKILLEKQNSDLKTVLNDIATSKIEWINEKTQQLNELIKKESEADNVIKRKSELNEQEEKLRQIEQSTIDARNETRQNILTVEGKEATIKAKEREILEREKSIEIEKEKIIKDRLDFKNKVVEVLKKIEKI